MTEFVASLNPEQKNFFRGMCQKDLDELNMWASTTTDDQLKSALLAKAEVVKKTLALMPV